MFSAFFPEGGGLEPVPVGSRVNMLPKGEPYCLLCIIRLVHYYFRFYEKLSLKTDNLNLLASLEQVGLFQILAFR